MYPLSAPHTGPIGVFDSGYGGLTILGKFIERLPQYDYLYLGDNARAPYGTRSFEVVYDFTLQAVKKLFELGCPLVILACNTASAKALRSIQQNDLPHMDPTRRVLGVIRPTVECIGEITRNGHVGLLATAGTVRSESYPLEIKKIFPDIQVTGMACPMWVPLVENKEYDGDGADYFVKKYIDTILQKDPDIDTLILGCTHYPLLLQKIRQYTPSHIRVFLQDGINVFLDEIVGSVTVVFLVLYQWHPHGAGHSCDLNVRKNLFNFQRIGFGAYGAGCGQQTNVPVTGDFTDAFHGGAYYSQYAAGRIHVRKVVLLDAAERFGGSRIAGQDDQRAAQLKQFLDSLQGEVVDHFERTCAVWSTGIISQVQVIVLWQSFDEFS
jgi:glutamate racemase